MGERKAMVAEASCHGEVCSDRTAEMSGAPPPPTHTPAVLKICGLHPEGKGKTLKGLNREVT